MSGPEGTPNGVDRLAQIAVPLRRAYDQGRISARSFEDVVALVEIAKAAHDTVDAYEADVAWEDLRVTELAAALARLDSGAAGHESKGQR